MTSLNLHSSPFSQPTSPFCTDIQLILELRATRFIRAPLLSLGRSLEAVAHFRTDGMTHGLHSQLARTIGLVRGATIDPNAGARNWRLVADVRRVPMKWSSSHRSTCAVPSSGVVRDNSAARSSIADNRTCIITRTVIAS